MITDQGLMKKYQSKANHHKDMDTANLLFLKSKGLSSEKISKMVAIPVRRIDQHFKTQKKYKQLFGVF